jgi:hypothetical protein
VVAHWDRLQLTGVELEQRITDTYAYACESHAGTATRPFTGASQLMMIPWQRESITRPPVLNASGRCVEIIAWRQRSTGVVYVERKR